ncbi:NAD-dependent epimerase/dehydratase family protein [Nannocystis pusilla]|uniref:NAD-dependent epimerase/dehydratase family protein n=1 Tax=Nannocystis pusilla TaxID=889268 RepID=A0A9X3IX07_9BACT|nr:NAD-dependent epimerase/dehydratase family protein [Nannocystis pusilla]
MRVAVAGASGFIGQATVHALLQAGHAVVGLSRGRRGRFDRPGLVWREVDVSRGGPSWWPHWRAARRWSTWWGSSGPSRGSRSTRPTWRRWRR